MKRYAYFSLIAAAMLATSGCVKHEEIEFVGKVMWVRECTPSIMDMNAGYVVSLESPAGVGADIVNSSGETLQNLVVLYEPTRRIYVGDTLSGHFYLDNSYSRANCSLRYTDYDLPEGVFTEINKR